MPLLQTNNNGLYCAVGNFYVDPWRSVDLAVTTHAHSDHVSWGCKAYLTTPTGYHVLRERLGLDATIQTQPYGRPLEINGVRISFHPAGHVLGSAQVRLEHGGEVWVVSGDYKLQIDRTAEPFESVKCHTFVTESTFGLPIYHWCPQEEVFAEINDWWRGNIASGRTSILYAYSLGKSQRVLGGLDAGIGPILAHGAVYRMIGPYRECGIELPPVEKADLETSKREKGRAMILAPPSADNTPWLKKYEPYSTAFASGWMAIRGTRRRRAADRGFIISDHADWESLLTAIKATEAENVLVTHGYTDALSRFLNENGWKASVLPTRYVGEIEEEQSAIAEGE